MPIPSQQDKVRAVFGERAALYTTSQSHTDKEILAWLVKCANPDPQWTAIDIATGAGHTAFALAPHLTHVVGTDITLEMLDEAKRLQLKNGLKNVTFQAADVHQLPFAPCTFDLATSRRAPHHFSNIQKALGEIARVLKPGGRLVIDDRSIPEDDEVDRIMNQLDMLHDESHVRQYRPSEWGMLLREAGFLVELMEPYSRLRPISHMKEGVAAAHAFEIDRMMSGLTDRQKVTMQVSQKDGELEHLHFFVMIAAVKGQRGIGATAAAVGLAGRPAPAMAAGGQPAADPGRGGGSAARREPGSTLRHVDLGRAGRHPAGTGIHPAEPRPTAQESEPIIGLIPF